MPQKDRRSAFVLVDFLAILVVLAVVAAVLYGIWLWNPWVVYVSAALAFFIAACAWLIDRIEGKAFFK